MPEVGPLSKRPLSTPVTFHLPAPVHAYRNLTTQKLGSLFIPGRGMRAYMLQLLTNII
jgi:hypothetical protein